jgi:hydroxyacylglutathione hydrolase
MKITDDLHAFLWNDPSTNNANTYLITGPKKILIDPGHAHLFEIVRNFDEIERFWFGVL